ncbi:MAG: hypothetical protein AABZ12_14395 [Planctomycetota bacterium]
MLVKIVAIVALVTLPLNAALWRRSHTQPVRFRWDMTLYKSVDVYMKDGLCGLHLLSMPRKTASRSEFEAPINYNPVPNNASLLFTSKMSGAYRHTWIVFPFWLPAVFLATCGGLPIAQGPVRRWWRVRHGRCVACAYDLRGTHSGRCPECGMRYA